MKMGYQKKVGVRLFQARKDKGLSRAALGKKINLHETTIKRYEDGDIKALDISKLIEFAIALDVSPEYLLIWDDETLTNTHKLEKDNPESRLLANYHQLNQAGQDRLVETSDELIQLKKFRK